MATLQSNVFAKCATSPSGSARRAADWPRLVLGHPVSVACLHHPLPSTMRSVHPGRHSRRGSHEAQRKSASAIAVRNAVPLLPFQCANPDADRMSGPAFVGATDNNKRVAAIVMGAAE